MIDEGSQRWDRENVVFGFKFGRFLTLLLDFNPACTTNFEKKRNTQLIVCLILSLIKGEICV